MPLSSVVGAQSIIKPGVCTSSTRPAVPFEGQMIYETDTDKVLVWNGSAWYANWNLPWGQVGLTTSTTLLQAGVTTVVDLTGMSVTFTAIASRNYKISAQMYGFPTVTNASSSVLIKQGATTLQNILTNMGVSGVGSSVTGFVIKTFTAGSTTLKLTGEVTAGSTGSMTFNSGPIVPAFILVEDIGPA